MNTTSARAAPFSGASRGPSISPAIAASLLACGLLCRRGGLDQHALAALHDAIVRPEQSRGDCPVRAPAFGERSHFLRGRTLGEIEGETRGLLQRKIAGRPGVRVSEAGK